MNAAVNTLFENDKERIELLSSCIFRARKEDATVILLIIDEVDQVSVAKFFVEK